MRRAPAGEHVITPTAGRPDEHIDHPDQQDDHRAVNRIADRHSDERADRQVFSANINVPRITRAG